MLKKFLSLFKPDNDDDDDTVKVKGEVKPKYYGTVCPYPNFSAESDAKELKEAISHKGVDENMLISVLVRRNNEQRQRIKAVYEHMTGRKLEKDITDGIKFKSDLEDVAVALLMTPAQLDAKVIWKATKAKLGTDEEDLIEVLTTRTNEEIRALKTAFKQDYKTELESVIADETDGDFRDVLLSLLMGDKEEDTEVNSSLARKDAEFLFESRESSKGKKFNEDTLTKILTKRSGPHLRKTLQFYKNEHDISIPKLIQRDLKGDVEDCFITLVKCAWNMPAFFAEKIHDAFLRVRRCDDTLIRILVGRSEIDLKKILEQYRFVYNKPLQQDIENEVRGHYKEVLLGLCGAH